MGDLLNNSRRISHTKHGNLKGSIKKHVDKNVYIV